MIPCKDNGSLTCYSHDGKLKSRWNTDKEAIEAAKIINNKYPKPNTKLVAYKCSHCGYYHLTTRLKTQKKWQQLN